MCLLHQLLSNVRHGLDFGFPVLWHVWKAGHVVKTITIHSLHKVSHAGEPDYVGILGT